MFQNPAQESPYKSNILVDSRIKKTCHGQMKPVWLWILMLCYLLIAARKR